jgi:hypothetical protein
MLKGGIASLWLFINKRQSGRFDPDIQLWGFFHGLFCSSNAGHENGNQFVSFLN